MSIIPLNFSDMWKRTLPYFCSLLIISGGVYLGRMLVNIPDQWEVVILFCAIAFYPVFRYPVVGIYILFTILPFIPYFRKLYYLVYQRPSVDPLIMLGDIVAAMIICGLYFVFRERREYDYPVRVFSKIIVVYLVYAVVRSVFYNELGMREGLLQIRFYVPQALMFFAGIVFAEDKKLLKNLLKITVTIAVVAALYGLKQLYLGYSDAERIWFSSVSFNSLFIGGSARPFSFFQSPAAFADYMQIAIFGLLVLVQASRSRLKHVYLLLLPLLCYAILITSVRSNWAGMVLSLFIWFTFLNVRGTRKRIAFIFFICLAFAVLSIWEEAFQSGVNPVRFAEAILGRSEDSIVNTLIVDRMGAVMNPFQEHSMLSRIALWKYVFSLSLNPFYAFIGRGTGALNVDSLYITYLAQFGYLGFFFIVALVVCFIHKGFTFIDNSRDRTMSVLVKGITAFNITFAVMNLTGTHIHAFPGDTYFWLLNGVLIKQASLIKDKRDENETAACNTGFPT
ncbi:MAG: hypothetical protein ACOCW1_01980 [Chitinispirillaceae bacterium]